MSFRNVNQLPVLVETGDYHRLITSGVGPAVFTINLLCLVTILSKSKHASIMHLGVFVASLASLLDVSLTLFAGGRYLIGWYIARCNSLFASVALLCVLLSAITQLYRTIVQQQSKIIYLANHDPLTELANRRLFSTSVEDLQGFGDKHLHFSIFMIDLDGFKQINDTFGHGTGDSVLRETALRLKQSVRTEDVVARLGGDEFVLLVTSVTNISDIEGLSRRILESLQNPIELVDEVVQVTGSVGISLHPNNAVVLTDLLRTADLALYEAKKSGKNQYRFYHQIDSTRPTR